MTFSRMATSGTTLDISDNLYGHDITAKCLGSKNYVSIPPLQIMVNSSRKVTILRVFLRELTSQGVQYASLL